MWGAIIEGAVDASIAVGQAGQSRRQERRSREYDTAMWGVQQEADINWAKYQANREDTKYQRQVEDMRKAGINPMMMVQGAHAPQNPQVGGSSARHNSISGRSTDFGKSNIQGLILKAKELELLKDNVATAKEVNKVTRKEAKLDQKITDLKLKDPQAEYITSDNSVYKTAQRFIQTMVETGKYNLEQAKSIADKIFGKLKDVPIQLNKRRQDRHNKIYGDKK